MAFIGAATTLGHLPDGELGVVDVGGGSSELVVGVAPDEVRWSTSFALGSGDLADRCLRSDPPSEAQLRDAHDRVHEALAGIEVPQPAEAVAVGGSATSLRLFAGAVLDSAAFGRSLRLLATERAAVIAAALRARHGTGAPAAGRITDPAGRLGAARRPASDRPRWPARGRPAGGLPCLAMTATPAWSRRSRRAKRSQMSGCGRRRVATGGSSSCSTASTPTIRSRRGGTSPRSTRRGVWACPTTAGCTSRSCSTSGCGWLGCCSGAASPRA